MIKSFARVLRVEPGFAAHNVLAMDLSLNAERYHERATAVAFVDDVIGRLKEVPGVESAGFTSHLPLSGEEGYRSFRIREQPVTTDANPDAEYRIVSTDYFGR